MNAPPGMNGPPGAPPGMNAPEITDTGAYYADASAILGVAILFPILAGIAITLRFMVRTKRKIPLGFDDWLCIPAWFMLMALAVVVYWGVSVKAVGYHSPSQSVGEAEDQQHAAQQSRDNQKASFLYNVFTVPALGFIKLSLLLFFRRIFRGNVFNIVSWVLIGIVTTWMVVTEFTWLFTCGSHIQYFWGPLPIIKSQCLRLFDELIASSCIGWCLDIIIMILPLTVIWQLQMPLAQKFAAAFVFLTGLISIAAGICRFVILYQMGKSVSSLKPGKTLGVDNADEVAMSTIAIFWTMIEVGVALCTVCLPALRPGHLIKLVKSYFTSYIFSRDGTSNNKSGRSKTFGSAGSRGERFGSDNSDLSKKSTSDDDTTALNLQDYPGRPSGHGEEYSSHNRASLNDRGYPLPEHPSKDAYVRDSFRTNSVLTDPFAGEAV